VTQAWGPGNPGDILSRQASGGGAKNEKGGREAVKIGGRGTRVLTDPENSFASTGSKKGQCDSQTEKQHQGLLIGEHHGVQWNKKLWFEKVMVKRTQTNYDIPRPSERVAERENKKSKKRLAESRQDMKFMGGGQRAKKRL